MFKRILAMVFVIVMLVTAIPMQAVAATSTKKFTTTKTYDHPDGAILESQKIVANGKAAITITGKVNEGAYSFLASLNSLYLSLKNKEGDIIWSDYVYEEDGKFSKTVTVKRGIYYVDYNSHCDCTVTVKTKIIPEYTKLKNFTLYTKENKKLKMSVKPSNYPLGKVNWKSSNTKVATVTSKGVVTAKKAGKSKITATVNGKKISCYVTVKNPTYSKLKSFSLYEKEKEQLKIVVKPSSYKYKSIKWKSSNTKVAVVNSKGVVVAKKAGKSKITATINGKNISCNVTVKKMAISSTKKAVYVKEPYQLEVYGGSGKIIWKSSDTKIAKVSQNGKVTAVKPGVATITAKRNGKVFKCKITAKWPAENGIVTEKVYKGPTGPNPVSKKFVLKGKSIVSVTGKVNSGTDSLYLVLEDEEYDNIWSEFIYKEDGTFKKTVSLDKGIYFVYYSTDNDATITLKTTTKPAILSERKTIGRGSSLKLSVAGVKNGGTWSVSNTSVATINSAGVLKGKKNGVCTVFYKMKDGKKISTKITVTAPVTCTVNSVSEKYIYNDCYVAFTNNTNKKIQYVEFNINQYDYKGRRLKSPYSYFYMDEFVEPGKTKTRYWWVNNDTKTASAYITEVKFTDGTYWRP